jgi:hypothetical protein
MQESEYNDGDSNMRRRFAEQTKKFWQESKQKEDTDRPSTREDRSCQIEEEFQNLDGSSSTEI